MLFSPFNKEKNRECIKPKECNQKRLNRKKNSDIKIKRKWEWSQIKEATSMNEKVDSRKIPIFHYIKWITTFAFSSHWINCSFVITVFARDIIFSSTITKRYTASLLYTIHCYKEHKMSHWNKKILYILCLLITMYL